MAREPKKKINEEKAAPPEKETKVVKPEENKTTTKAATKKAVKKDNPCELRDYLSEALKLAESGKFSPANKAKQGPSFQRRFVSQLKIMINQL
jgi:hypothetical protein